MSHSACSPTKALLARCQMSRENKRNTRFRGFGAVGGQKRNKTSNAVRPHAHCRTGVSATARPILTTSTPPSRSPVGEQALRAAPGLKLKPSRRTLREPSTWRTFERPEWFPGDPPRLPHRCGPHRHHACSPPSRRSFSDLLAKPSRAYPAAVAIKPRRLETTRVNQAAWKPSPHLWAAGESHPRRRGATTPDAPALTGAGRARVRRAECRGSAEPRPPVGPYA
jgi:hypothetical protein